jgi:hypothetical protein
MGVAAGFDVRLARQNGIVIGRDVPNSSNSSLRISPG